MNIINNIGFAFFGILLGILVVFSYIYFKQIKKNEEVKSEILNAQKLLLEMGCKSFFYRTSVKVADDDISKAISILISSGYLVLGKDGKVITNIVQMNDNKKLSIVSNNTKKD